LFSGLIAFIVGVGVAHLIHMFDLISSRAQNTYIIKSVHSENVTLTVVSSRGKN